MKKSLSGFASGVICTLLVCSFAISALAISGTVSFNKSPILFNGNVISAAGEGYTLSNGCIAPASITYTDERGGGTTFLPARRISELMGVDIGWDPATGAVTITGDAAHPDSKPAVPTPDPATLPDYSDWSAEDEAAYQEFKGMWEPKMSSLHFGNNAEHWYCFTDTLHNEIKDVVGEADAKGFVLRLATEISNGGTELSLEFIPRDGNGTSYFKQIVLPH